MIISNNLGKFWNIFYVRKLFLIIQRFLKLDEDIFSYDNIFEYFNKKLGGLYITQDDETEKELVNYVLQSTNVSNPNLYFTVSIRGSHAKDFAEKNTIDDTINFITEILKKHKYSDFYDIPNGKQFSIYPHQNIFKEWRLMTADQIVTFKTGSVKDLGFFLATILSIKGEKSILKLFYDKKKARDNDTAYVCTNDGIIFMVDCDGVSKVDHCPEKPDITISG